MPTIELLPTANTGPSAPGWAYVLEPAVDPSRLPIQPSSKTRNLNATNTRDNKRTAARSATDVLLGAHSKTQATRIRARLEELARDNPARVEIDVPTAIKREIGDGRWKITKGAGKGVGGGATGMGRQTTNVKRVVGSTKTWSHHAADEESRNQQNAEAAASRTRTAIGRTAKRATAADEGSTPADELPPNPSAANAGERKLLRADIPIKPSEEMIEALTSAPPLAYATACAGPSKDGQPARKFCDMCGYWGRMRCTVCGTYVCSLACKIPHDAAEHPHR